MSRCDDKTLLRDMIEAARSAIAAIQGCEQTALAGDYWEGNAEDSAST